MTKNTACSTPEEIPGSNNTPAPCVLELKDISRAFGPRLLFRKVNLRLQGGDIHIVHGANGAGKSSLMKIMAGLARPDSGEVIWHTEAENIIYVAHATFIYPGLTAKENLEFWGEASGIANAAHKADMALKEVALDRHAHERAGIFSRGMSQRLNLARILMTDARLLLLDEPGTGLDVSSRALLHRLIIQAADKGACVVWISHDLDIDGPLAHKVLHLENKTIHMEEGGRA